MKKFTVVMAFAGLAIVWAQGMGLGQGRGGMQNRPTFASYDLNRDGKITQDEFNTARTERMKKRFEPRKTEKPLRPQMGRMRSQVTYQLLHC